jgi:transcription elongation factor Elf1
MSSTYLDWKYLNQLNLSGYSKKSEYLANFSCPICNELHNSHHPGKKRGYLIEDNGSVYFHCHRCGSNMSAWVFIKAVDPALHKQYCLESFQDKILEPSPKVDSFVTSVNSWHEIRSSKKEISRIPFSSINELSPDHLARRYVSTRHIPQSKWERIYFVPKFMEWTNSLLPNMFHENVLEFDEPRIVFPFYNKLGNLHAYQGRSLNQKSNAKYITIVLDEKVPTIYGLDTVNWHEPVYVTEGPIDSMSIQNAIAVVGGDMVAKLCRLSFSFMDKENFILIFDNEPHSVHLKKRMTKAIEAGYKILFWPENVICKDINELAQGGVDPFGIKCILENFTKLGGESQFEQMKAILHLNAWSKV